MTGHARHTVRPNRIKAAIREKRVTPGYALTIPCPEIVEILGAADFEWVWFDGEHGAFDLRDIEALCRTADLVGVTPIARVIDISRPAINSYLDRGVQGIVAPHVDTADDAKRVVDATYYAPLGSRSYGAMRSDGFGYGTGDLAAYLAARNENMTVGIIIESADAVRNIDDIVAVKGVDYFLIGPIDLAQSLGHPGNPAHPDVREAIAHVEQRVHAGGSLMREDIMAFAFAQDLLLEGAAATLEGWRAGRVGRVIDPAPRLARRS